MDFTQISQTVKKYSPVLASMLDLSNPMLGLALSLLYKLFGSSSLDQLNEKIMNAPDASLRFKEIELKIQQINADSEYNISAINDVENARSRDEDLIKMASQPNATWPIIFNSVMPHFLTISVFFTIVFLVSIRLLLLDDSNDTFLAMIVVQLLSIFNSQRGFYYGYKKDDK